mmetsp:Transcript_28962/g.79446  ORF Transcript_28962/g.79446 Transcript_28962/m.79446 type:complete len:431 (+) Transcript_28962:137-1429(+)
MCLPASKARLDSTSTAGLLKTKQLIGQCSSSNSSSTTKKSSRHPQHHHHDHRHHPHYAPLVVQHNYHDHARDEAPDHISDPQELQLRCSASAPFPTKLEEMLNQVEGDGYSQVVSWQPHGRCFVIHKMAEFKALLPRYFKLSKIASFQRQLNLYGFQRITTGMDKGGYYHEYFLRGKSFLAYKIQRIKVKGTGVRGKSNPDQEPDFWSMEWVGTSSSSTSSKNPTSAVIAAPVSPNTTRSVAGGGARAAPRVSLPGDSAGDRMVKDSASVVSHEDEMVVLRPTVSSSSSHYRTNTVANVVPVLSSMVEEESLSLPDSSSRNKTSSIEMSWFGEESPKEVQEDAVMLCEWGKPFYALDSIPSDLFDRKPGRKPTSQRTVPTTGGLPIVSQYEIQDQQYLDQLLEHMLKDLQADKKRVQHSIVIPSGPVVSV